MRALNGFAVAGVSALLAAAGSAYGGVVNLSMTGAFQNSNWDNSSGWDKGEEWGWADAGTNPTTGLPYATAWANENWIAGGTGSLNVSVTVDSDPDVTITKNLVNNTGFAWTSFTIDLVQVSPFGVPSVYAGSLGSSRFSSNSTVNGPTTASMVWNMSGTDTPVLPGQSVSFFFTFNIPGDVVFKMVQTPVPTPGATSLLGLGALVALRRRR